MKTTFDLPESLVFEAKKAALTRKVTLRTLVERGLRRELEDPSPASATSPLQSLRALDASIWTQVSADAYVADQRKDWE
jgi:hypothetical protein